MKKLISLLFLLFISASSYAQLPDAVLDSVIVTLYKYKHLQLEYNHLDSTFQIYKVELGKREKVISDLSLTVEQQATIIGNLEAQNIIVDKIQEADRERFKKVRRQRNLLILVDALVVVLILL